LAFYTNFFLRGNKIYTRGYDKGLAFQDVEEYKPYLFALDKRGKEYKTIDGRSVSKIDFENVRAARDFVERYKDVEQFPIYGNTNYAYVYINDRFPGEIEFDPFKVSVVTLDIECDSENGFPDVDSASQELTAITLRKKNKSAVFSYGDFHTDDPNIYYVKCEDEVDLITKFLKIWNSNAWRPDIVTGWYIELFDIPYLVNRITRVMGEAEAKKLSPWKMIDKRIMEFRGKENVSYTLFGVSILDYYQLYRKFSFKNHESYSLNYICYEELGEKKIDYKEQGSLHNLYKNDFRKFIEYNIHDCVLVDKLDDKLKLIEQVMALAYDAKVNFIDTLTTVRSWDTIIHNYLMRDNIVVSPMENHKSFSTLVGGYVKDPRVGMHKWVVSFDLNSLYPHLIMQYNISPETFVGRTGIPAIESLLDGEWSLDDDEVTCAANGCKYSKEKQGFLPALMEKMYNDRSLYKDKMIEAKIEYEKTKDPEAKKLVSRYHNLQLAKKIQLNSAYGALANQYFRWFNFNHAEAITMSGQLSIRWIEKDMNTFMNKLMQTEDVDYIIASDTDSIYVDMGPLVESTIKDKTDHEICRIIDRFAKEKIKPYMDKSYASLAKMMNARAQKMQMKRETIANKAIWKAKKMYMMNALNVEGVEYKEPSLKIQGIEAVRSSTPNVCRDAINKAITIMMNGSSEDLRSYIVEFRKKFDTLSFEDVAFPRGMNGIKEYRDASNLYKKGTPIHVKGALIFNSLISKHRLKNIIPIGDGDKIKFVYLKLPNPIRDRVISAPNFLPKEFGLDSYIDRDTQFEKSFLDPISSIVDIIGWKIDNKASIESFFD
jgi:DNA polymerase elongation subunit (family B)